LLAAAHAASAAHVVEDDTGAKVTLPSPPGRIVSLAPGATEMLFAAGADDRFVGTAEFSTEPAGARDIPRIGDATAVDVERIVSLRPDVIVAWPGGNPAAHIERLATLRIPIYRQRVARLQDIPASLRRLGLLARTSIEAERAALVFERRLAALESRHRGDEAIEVFLQVWNLPLYTIGGAHLMTDALRLCAAHNIFADLREAAPLISPEAVIARNPQIIIAAAPVGRSREWLDGWRRFSSLRAVRADALLGFEDQRLSRLGPSALDATEALCKLIDSRGDDREPVPPVRGS
jgi:iron complex transport system substrate-binding protein